MDERYALYDLHGNSLEFKSSFSYKVDGALQISFSRPLVPLGDKPLMSTRKLSRKTTSTKCTLTMQHILDTKPSIKGSPITHNSTPGRSRQCGSMAEHD
jgi:hypothetical protein